MFVFTETHLKRHYVVVGLRIVTLPTDHAQALTPAQLLHLTIMDNCIFKMEAVVVPLLLTTEYWFLMVVTPMVALH